MSEQRASTRRTTFYDELIRRRRAAWIVASACALLSAGVGLVLSTIITPILLLVAGGLLKLVVLLGVIDSLALDGVALIHDFVAAHLDNVDRLSRTLDHVNGLGDMVLLAGPLARLAPTALPALLAALLVWLWLSGLFARSSSQDLIVRLAARPARLDDFEERQLANIVEEVAIGAGAPPPALFLIDTPTVNAAALGSPGGRHDGGLDNGIVLFTRGLLDRLDRSETEAVAARLVSAIGSGDLRAASGIMAALRTLGFFLALLDLPLRRSARRTFSSLLRVSLSRQPGADTLARLGEDLEEGLQADAIPDLETIASEAPRLVAKVVRVLLLPFYVVSLFYKLVLFLWTSLFLGPPLALLWRNRCYWTDARAVQLARNPESFATALEKIGAADPPPGGEAFAYLFIAAPTTARRAVTDRRSLALALTPPTHKRLERLGALGAAPRIRRMPTLASLFATHPLRALVVAALGLLLVPLFAILVVAIGFLTSIVMMAGLVAGLALVHALI
jgi:Zn-dependent protease with chaperone function